MGHHVLDGIARGREWRAQNSLGVFGKILTDGRGDGQADVRIHIDFANAHARSLAQHVFGYALGSANLSAKLVAQTHKFLRNAGSAVQNQRIARQLVANAGQAVKIKFGFALELVRAVACADGNGQLNRVVS